MRPLLALGFVASVGMPVHLEEIIEGLLLRGFIRGVGFRVLLAPLSRHPIEKYSCRNRHIHTLRDASHGNRHQAIGGSQRPGGKSVLLVAEQKGEFRLAEIDFEDRFRIGIKRGGDDMPPFLFQGAQGFFAAVAHAIVEPFIGRGRTVLAHFFGVKFGMRIEDDIDFLNAESIATAGDSAKIMRIKDVFNHHRQASLPLRGDAFEFVHARDGGHR